jgi:hypothetical protein
MVKAFQYIRLEFGFFAPHQRCGHRHRTVKGARRCGEATVIRAGSDAARFVVVSWNNTVVHVERYDGEQLAKEPWDPAIHEIFR